MLLSGFWVWVFGNSRPTFLQSGVSMCLSSDCLCVYVICVCIVHVFVFVRIFSVCVFVYIYLCIYVCMYMFVCVCLCTFVYVFFCVCPCMSEYMCVCVRLDRSRPNLISGKQQRSRRRRVSIKGTTNTFKSIVGPIGFNSLLRDFTVFMGPGFGFY